VSAQAPALTAGLAWLQRGRSRLGAAAERVERLPVPAVLGGLIVVEWASVLALARTVRHAGWIYYQGGDQLWYYTLGWALGHGELRQTPVGYGWSALLAPLARIAGPNLVSALPAIILFNVLVLLPIAMLALYGTAARIGGRIFGYWALALWIAVPFVGILYTNTGYHQRYTELLLPQAFGLTALADFPTMVATLVSVYFCARVLLDDEPRAFDAVAAGAAAGIAIGIKPATALFLLGPALAFVYRRRFATIGLFVAGIAPALLALAIWKERGLGSIPAFSNASPTHRLAAGAVGDQSLGAVDFGRYLKLNWSHLGNNIDLLREHFWSGRVLQWLVIAGLIGLARRSRTAFLLVGGWFAAFAIIKGSYLQASVEDGSIFRIMMPVFPAFILLLASLPLLFPHAPRLIRPWRAASVGGRASVRWSLLGATIALSAVAPLAAFAAADTQGGDAEVAALGGTIMPIPVNVDLGLTARSSGSRVLLSWRAGKSVGGPVFYRVWRGPASGGDGLTCPSARGARTCYVQLPEIGVSKTGSFVDHPGKGRWVYRVTVAANWLDNPTYGDIYLVGSPIRIATG
jgi:hypothetical protein